MAAAVQLQRDVCLMQTNLDVLDQYTLSLQGTASKLIEKCLEASDFPAAEVAAGALGPRVHHASVQMEAMGQPSRDWSRTWLDALSWDQAMAAAVQLQRDVCLMQTNLDVLDQYALSLQGTASK